MRQELLSRRTPKGSRTKSFRELRMFPAGLVWLPFGWFLIIFSCHAYGEICGNGAYLCYAPAIVCGPEGAELPAGLFFCCVHYIIF